MIRFAKFRIVWAAIIAAALLSGACSILLPSAEYAVAVLRWEENGPASYRYTIALSCFCAPDTTRPVVITVIRGETASLVYEDDGEAALESTFASYDTMDKVLTYIGDAIADGADLVEAVYDEELGYPNEFFIDRSFNAADEEIGATISGFTPLRDDGTPL